MKPDSEYYLEIMREYGIRAVRYLTGVSKEEFQNNEEKQDSISHVLYRFAEASIQIDDAFKKKYNQIVWKDIHAFRVLLAHVYHKVDMTILYNIVLENIPVILEQIIDVLEKLRTV